MVLSVCLGVCRRQRRNSLLFRQRNDAVVGTSIYSTTAATATMAVPSVYVPVSTPNGATAYAPQVRARPQRKLESLPVALFLGRRARARPRLEIGPGPRWLTPPSRLNRFLARREAGGRAAIAACGPSRDGAGPCPRPTIISTMICD